MSTPIFLLILISITLSALAQIVLKFGMSSPEIQEALLSKDFVDIIQTVTFNLLVLGGLFLYFLSALVWLLVLARVDVSVAYPFVGLGFILTMILAYFFQHEPITTTKIFATFLIAIGVAVMARGQ